MKQKRVRLGVVPELGFAGIQPILSAIGKFMPVDFVPVGEAVLPSDIDGVIALVGNRTGDTDYLATARAVNVPMLLFKPGTGAAIRRRSNVVEFRALRSLDPCLRGQHLEDADVVSFVPLVPDSADEIVGLMEGRPFWLRRGTGMGRMDVVALDPPSLAEEERLLDCFQPGRFVRLLPLLEFVRTRTVNVDWDCGPFRACFVFDDPSLVRPRYGCLDFRALASHARAHGYHAAIATVPLDAARADNETVEIFRANTPHLSLLLHGNDHTRLELLRCRSRGARQALLAHALRRIEAFERRHGLVVDRVLEAPHGCVARAMFPDMAALGFESAMTTFRHLLHFEPTEPWSSHIGMDISEIMPGGISTIPRVRMLPDWRTAVVLAGFLRQPTVIAGHHHDAVDGLDFLATFAEMVRGFGPVRWLSPANIARSNFKVRHEGSHLLVKTYQRRVDVPIPDGVDHLSVERAWLTDGASERMTLASQASGPMFSGVCDRRSPVLRVRSGESIEIRSFHAQPLNPYEIPPPPRRLWPVFRHFMTNTRDRYYPWFH